MFPSSGIPLSLQPGLSLDGQPWEGCWACPHATCTPLDPAHFRPWLVGRQSCWGWERPPRPAYRQGPHPNSTSISDKLLGLHHPARRSLLRHSTTSGTRWLQGAPSPPTGRLILGNHCKPHPTLLLLPEMPYPPQYTFQLLRTAASEGQPAVYLPTSPLHSSPVPRYSLDLSNKGQGF